MQIGMVTTVPQNREQRQKLIELSILLARAADFSEAYAAITGTMGITIEGHNAEDFFESLSQQIMATATKE